jgi:hypothetical protein
MYTLQGKIRSTRHTLFTLDPRRVPNHTSHVVHVGNISLVPTRSKQAPTPRISLGDQRQTGLAVVFGHLILPPLRQPWNRGERIRSSGYTTILNRHRWELQPWRCRLSTSHSPTFPTSDLHFSPKGPARSQVIHTIIINWTKEGTNPKSHEWKPPLDFYRNISFKHSITNDKPPRDMVNKGN